MLSEIWKFLNAPIVIVAIVVLALLFVLGPRVYTRSEPHSSSTSQYEGSRRYLSKNAGVGGTHFGYLGSMQYASEVPADGVLNGPQWQPSSGDPPLSPSEAVASIRTALVDLIPELADISVGNVNLSREASDYFTYIVEFNTQDDISSMGLRLVALMDGTWLYR